MAMYSENTTGESSTPTFDRYADDYDGVLNKALSASGETREYYARARVLWLRDRLNELGVKPCSVLDYGCGTGGSVPFLLEILQPGRILGVDISPKSIRQACKEHPEKGVEFAVFGDYSARSEFDLAFCNGVFHHISSAERPAALRYVYDSLRPGGIFAFWENNPWNPATRYIMRRCEFDREAITISLPRAKALLRGMGFQLMHTSSRFYFPRWLKGLRPLEPALASLPLGGEYLVLGRKCY
jgi:SAM-dependent methyltransferase